MSLEVDGARDADTILTVAWKPSAMDTVISFGGRQCAQREQDTLKMTRMRHSLLKKQYNYYQALVKSTTGYVTTYQVSYHSTISLESFATPAYDLSLSKKNPKRRARPLKIRNIGPHIAKLYSMYALWRWFIPKSSEIERFFLVGSYIPIPGIKCILPGTMVYKYHENSFSGNSLGIMGSILRINFFILKWHQMSKAFPK